MLDYFDIRVRYAHNIDKILDNRFNYKTGSIYYIESEEYEKRINLCYDLIEKELRAELVDFIKISLPILKAEIQHIKRNIEYKNNSDDSVQDFLLAFVKSKYKFFKKWVKQKNKEIKEDPLKIEDIGDEGINKHTKIFDLDGFEIFQKWMNASSDNLDKKISFIFQKLKQEDKLITTNFKKLSKWSYENNYLDETTYNKLLITGSFLSPTKILTKGRLESYKSIIKN